MARSPKFALYRETLQTTGCDVGRIVNRNDRVCDDACPASPASFLALHRIPRRPGMRFLRHGGIFRSDVAKVKIKNQTQTLGWGRAASRWSALSPGTRTCREDHALIIVFDEFRPANP